MTINCIIDTCSCICLSNSEFNQKTLLELLHKKVSLNYSKEIHVELRDHKDKNLPKFIHDERLRKKTRKYPMDEYERRMLGNVLISRVKKGDKGEIDNFLLSVDQIHHTKINSLIFITDDKKALRGVLADWITCFPAIKIWSSFEVILYLYAESVIPSKDIAVEKIKDIIFFTAPSLADRKQKTPEELNKTSQALIALTKDYSNRIEKISLLLK